MTWNKINMVGQRFGQLVIIKQTSEERRPIRWHCKCDCGELCTTSGILMRQGITKSCGCYRRERGREHGSTIRLRHGEARDGQMTSEYRTWDSMKQRCSNPNHRQFANYGGRGIRVCRRWQKFENFLADMGRRSSDRHSLDRINNNRGYSLANCRWATSTQQNRNNRGNRRITINGVSKTLVEWLETAPISAPTFHRRVKAGMTPARALVIAPKTPGNRKKKCK